MRRKKGSGLCHRGDSCLDVVASACLIGMVCTMCTAVELSACFDTVADDLARAVRAAWRAGVDGTFKAVKCMSFALHRQLEGLVVIVAANFALSHVDLLLKREQPQLHVAVTQRCNVRARGRY